MKKFLSYIHWKHLKHLYHVEEKKIPHYHRILQSFFRSRNGKLVIILIIAAMIPMTVLGVQTVQNLTQEAATNPICGEGDALNFVVNPQPAMQGQQVTFSLKDGGMLDNELHGFGNGVTANTCQQSGNNITCTAKGGFATNDPPGKIKRSTWFTIAGGTSKNLCEYAIQKVAAAPTPRPSGSRQPTQCKASISAYCKGETTPGINVNWEYPATATCSIEVKDKQGNVKFTSTKCKDDQTTYEGIENKKDYTITAKATGCADYTRTVTTSCGVPATPTSQQPGNGTPANTPAPGSPIPGTESNPKITKRSCELIDGKLKIVVAWDSPPSGTTATKLRISGNGQSFEQNVPNREYIFSPNANKPLESGKTYNINVSFKIGDKNPSSSVTTNTCPQASTQTPTSTPEPAAQAQQKTRLEADGGCSYDGTIIASIFCNL